MCKKEMRGHTLLPNTFGVRLFYFILLFSFSTMFVCNINFLRYFVSIKHHLVLNLITEVWKQEITSSLSQLMPDPD